MAQAERDEREILEMQRRVRNAVLLLVTIFVIGVIGFRILGGDQHGWLEAIYMATVILTTVGIREVIPTTSEPAMVFTTLYLLFGATAAVYTLSTITAFIVEGDLTQGFRRRRMQAQIDKMNGHIIICGAGQTGQSVLTELRNKIGRAHV